LKVAPQLVGGGYLMEGRELGLLMLSVTALSVLLLRHGAGAQRSIHSALSDAGCWELASV
jgi:hypothetical protein